MNTKIHLPVVIILCLSFFGCNEKEEIVLPNNCPEIITIYSDSLWVNDYYIINEASLNEDGLLNINISHSGGCEEHDYQLLQDPLFCGTPPIYISMKLSHNANGDLCEAWITKDLCFDISSIYSEENEDITIGLYNSHQVGTTWTFE